MLGASGAPYVTIVGATSEAVPCALAQVSNPSQNSRTAKAVQPTRMDMSRQRFNTVARRDLLQKDPLTTRVGHVSGRCARVGVPSRLDRWLVPWPAVCAAETLCNVLVEQHGRAGFADAAEELQHAAEVADVKHWHLQLYETCTMLGDCQAAQ